MPDAGVMFPAGPNVHRQAALATGLSRKRLDQWAKEVFIRDSGLIRGRESQLSPQCGSIQAKSPTRIRRFPPLVCTFDSVSDAMGSAPHPHFLVGKYLGS